MEPCRSLPAYHRRDGIEATRGPLIGARPGTPSAGPIDTEGNRIGERAGVPVDAENGERIARDSAIVPRAIQGVVDGAVLLHEMNGALEVVGLDLALGQCALPKRALLVAAATKT